MLILISDVSPQEPDHGLDATRVADFLPQNSGTDTLL